MKCIINGDSFSFDQEQSLYDVLTALELDPKRVIVVLNKEIINHDKFYLLYTINAAAEN